jgi:hypothetical protein
VKRSALAPNARARGHFELQDWPEPPDRLVLRPIARTRVFRGVSLRSEVRIGTRVTGCGEPKSSAQRETVLRPCLRDPISSTVGEKIETSPPRAGLWESCLLDRGVEHGS